MCVTCFSLNRNQETKPRVNPVSPSELKAYLLLGLCFLLGVNPINLRIALESFTTAASESCCVGFTTSDFNAQGETK